MADVDDQWHKTVDGKRVRTDKYGKGKRWRARWRDETGQQRQQSFDIKVDADRHLATVTADMLRKTYIDPIAGRVTFKAYAEKWRANQIHQDTTATHLKIYLDRHVYPVFGDRQMASIKRSDGQAWIRGMETGRDKRSPLMPASIESIYRFVVAICHAAVADKVIAENPFVKLARPKIVKKRVAPPDSKQVEAIQAHMREPLRTLVDVGAGLGARQGEAIALEVDCIDFLRRQVAIRQQLVQLPGTRPYLRLPKGNKARTVPAADVVLIRLAEHIRRFPPQPFRIEDRTNPAKPVWRDAYLLFTSPQGMPLRKPQFSTREWGTARAAAGLPAAFTFHDLRHRFASALIRYGESVKTVQERLGHASAVMTLDTYGHLWPDSEDRTRAAIEDAFAGDVGQMWGNAAEG